MLAIALTAIAVLVGFGYGIHALRLMRDQPNRSTLRLAALNLLEPSATIGTLLTIFVATDAANSGESAPLLQFSAHHQATDTWTLRTRVSPLHCCCTWQRYR